MTNGYPYEMLLPCWCGDRPILEVHDNHYWVSCSCESWKHDMFALDYPEVGGFDGFETDEEAVLEWNKLMGGALAKKTTQNNNKRNNVKHKHEDALPVPDETETIECVCDGVGYYGKKVTIHVMECPECGRTYEHVNGDYERCPHCGTKFGEMEE